MDIQHILLKYPDLKDIFYFIRYEIHQAQRPADEVILDDEDVMKKLKISKRKLQYLKADGAIPVRKLEPGSPRSYYFLSDILELLKKNCTDSINSKF